MKKLLLSIKTFFRNNKKIIGRFILLVLSVPLGILLLIGFVKYCESGLVCFLGWDPGSKFIDSFRIILLGLPVFTCLWWFRTHDIKEQINQNNYFKGLDNLASEERLKVEIAVQQLRELSKIAGKYKEDIKLAFIKRLKNPLRPLNKEEQIRYFYSYAQYIVDWLSENYDSTELDLTGCNFDYQEFKIETNFAIFRNKENSLEHISFVGADLCEAKLSGAILSRAILDKAAFNGADLREVNFSQASLFGSNLSTSNLSGADLNGANLRKVFLVGANLFRARLIGVNLSGSDLREVDLNQADLSLADLREANLGGSNLSGANLEDAFFDSNQHPIGVDFEELGYELEDIVINNTNSSKLVKKNN